MKRFQFRLARLAKVRELQEEIARAEWYKEGKVPLQTLRVPIDYGFTEARTGYGIIGVKCWINKKEEAEKETKDGETPQPRRPRRSNDGPPKPAAS